LWILRPILTLPRCMLLAKPSVLRCTLLVKRSNVADNLSSGCRSTCCFSLLLSVLVLKNGKRALMHVDDSIVLGVDSRDFTGVKSSRINSVTSLPWQCWTKARFCPHVLHSKGMLSSLRLQDRYSAGLSRAAVQAPCSLEIHIFRLSITSFISLY
jgi:hypothetical protein